MASFTYDVFINFRGEDTRYTFVGYLRKELWRKGINTFSDDDDDNLRVGEGISDALSKAIEESKISIILLSENYATSTWCLDELVKILACRKRNSKQLVFPVFYHVDPSDVRHQKNNYGKAITTHENRFGKNYHKLPSWKLALAEVCAVKGFHITTGYEINFIEQIVQKVYDSLDLKPLHVGQDPVGLEEVTSLTYIKPNANTVVVHLRSLDKPDEDDFCLEMSWISTYDDVVKRVAQQLGLDDPSKIRLTTHNYYAQIPKPQPIKYRGVDHLSDMLVHYNQTSDILYHEVLDIPLPELQGLTTMKVEFHHVTKDEVVTNTIILPKKSTVGDVLDNLKTKVELSHTNAELRLLKVFDHMIYEVLPPDKKIENLSKKYLTLRAEEIPEEEKNLGPHDRLIHVYHFTKDTTQTQMKMQYYGEPFLLVVHEDETLAEIKVRIQKKLRIPDDEFVKWKFAVISLGLPEYLQDSDIVSSCFERIHVYGAWKRYLGLEHY